MLSREIIRKVLEAREQRREVAILFCDLSKAFDVADHSILALKLKHYGIRGSALRLVESFMCNRTQYVSGDHGKIKSDGLSSKIGVPQGSSLSNLAFSLLLNDLPEAVIDGDVFMYADDVAAIVTAPALESLERQLNTVAAQLLGWFKNNGLKLNLTKTQYLVFSLSGRTRRSLVVDLEGEPLEQVLKTTFLGFQLDAALTWESHIDSLCGKLGSSCFALSRVASTLPRQEVLACYFASVQSLLQYGLELWGRAAEWERVFRMQKRAVRAIAQISRRDTARPHFARLGILTLPCLLIMQIAVYAREHLHVYAKRGDKHTYKTRHADKLAGVPHSLKKASKTIHSMGPDVYNKLPKNITGATSIITFKIKLKKMAHDYVVLLVYRVFRL